MKIALRSTVSSWENDFVTNGHPDKLTESCTTFHTRELIVSQPIFQAAVVFPKTQSCQACFVSIVTS